VSQPRSAIPLTLAVAFSLALVGPWSVQPALAAGDVRHTVREGDTPASIAGQLKMSLFDFLAQLGGMLVPGKDITVCPPGTEEADFKSEYIRPYPVKPSDVKLNETWVNICRALADQKMDIEEIADFNSVPRQYHLVLAGETLASIAKIYDSALKPLARFINATAPKPPSPPTTPATLIRGWNRLDETPDLAEGRLLTVGWQEPLAGDKLYYPEVAKMIASVTADQEKAGLITPKGALFFDPNVSYQLYVLREGQTLEDLARQCNNTDVAKLRKANDLDASETPAPGQALFVPTAESAFAGTPSVYKAKAKTGAVMRNQPSTLARSLTIEAGEVLYVFERPWETDGAQWWAVMVDSETRPWAWMQADHLEREKDGRRYYATGRKGPPRPHELLPSDPTVVDMSNVSETTNSEKKRQALAIAMWFVNHQVPYRMGSQCDSRTDCSGLVWLCLTRAGVWDRGTERDAAQTQALRGRKVSSPMPADRLYWEYGRLGGAIDHTGFYLGGGMDIEATPKYTRIKSFSSRQPHLVKIMRDPPY
jgi:LysM repeat protein